MGDDGIQLELIKYGPDLLLEEIANNLNYVLETHSTEIQFGQSIRLPILKPKKIPGPVKHLRPLNLLKIIRKILSTVTLNIIKSKTDMYLSQSQAAYRQNRATTDILWAHRFIIAKTLMYQDLSVNITGMHTSSAFDTIDRHELLK